MAYIRPNSNFGLLLQPCHSDAAAKIAVPHVRGGAVRNRLPPSIHRTCPLALRINNYHSWSRNSFCRPNAQKVVLETEKDVIRMQIFQLNFLATTRTACHPKLVCASGALGEWKQYGATQFHTLHSSGVSSICIRQCSNGGYKLRQGSCSDVLRAIFINWFATHAKMDA